MNGPPATPQKKSRFMRVPHPFSAPRGRPSLPHHPGRRSVPGIGRRLAPGMTGYTSPASSPSSSKSAFTPSDSPGHHPSPGRKPEINPFSPQSSPLMSQKRLMKVTPSTGIRQMKAPPHLGLGSAASSVSDMMPTPAYSMRRARLPRSGSGGLKRQLVLQTAEDADVDMDDDSSSAENGSSLAHAVASQANQFIKNRPLWPEAEQEAESKSKVKTPLHLSLARGALNSAGFDVQPSPMMPASGSRQFFPDSSSSDSSPVTPRARWGGHATGAIGTPIKNPQATPDSVVPQRQRSQSGKRRAEGPAEPDDEPASIRRRIDRLSMHSRQPAEGDDGSDESVGSADSVSDGLEMPHDDGFVIRRGPRPPLPPFAGTSLMTSPTPEEEPLYMGPRGVYDDYLGEAGMGVGVGMGMGMGMDSPAMHSQFQSDFVEHEMIAQGSFGTVFKCKHVLDGMYYAVKKSKKAYRSRSERQHMLKEVFALSAATQASNSPYLLQYYHAWEEDHHLYIQTELCDFSAEDMLPEDDNDLSLTGSRVPIDHLLNHGGACSTPTAPSTPVACLEFDDGMATPPPQELERDDAGMSPSAAVVTEGRRKFSAKRQLKGGKGDFAIIDASGRVANRGKCSASMVHKFLRHCLHGLCALHDANIVHLDIKPGNVLYRNGMFKLGDLGLAQREDTAPSEVDEGDARYLPRELLQGNAHNLSASDIFSLGASAYELARGVRLPSRGEEWQELRDRGVRASMLTHISPTLVGLLNQMLAPDPMDRPVAAKLLHHPLLTSGFEHLLQQQKDLTRRAEIAYMDLEGAMRLKVAENSRLQHKLEARNREVQMKDAMIARLKQQLQQQRSAGSSTPSSGGSLSGTRGSDASRSSGSLHSLGLRLDTAPPGFRRSASVNTVPSLAVDGGMDDPDDVPLTKTSSADRARSGSRSTRGRRGSGSGLGLVSHRRGASLSSGLVGRSGLSIRAVPTRHQAFDRPPSPAVPVTPQPGGTAFLQAMGQDSRGSRRRSGSRAGMTAVPEEQVAEEGAFNGANTWSIGARSPPPFAFGSGSNSSHSRPGSSHSRGRSRASSDPAPAETPVARPRSATSPDAVPQSFGTIGLDLDRINSAVDDLDNQAPSRQHHRSTSSGRLLLDDSHDEPMASSELFQNFGPAGHKSPERSAMSRSLSMGQLQAMNRWP